MKKLLVAVAIILVSASAAFGQLGTTTATQNLVLTVGPEAALVVPVASASANFSAPTNFASYTATSNFTFFVRTTTAGGSGNITLKVTTDFSNGSGNQPSVATPPTAGDILTYAGSTSAPGTGAAGTASTGSATNVVTFGANAHTTNTGVVENVNWTFVNDPLYPTGTYTATVTYTISAS